MTMPFEQSAVGSLEKQTKSNPQRDAGSSSPPFVTRMCQGTCGNPIPRKRLEIVRNARMCAPCQEAAGDVPRLRRFDDYGVDGEVVQTVFTGNKDIQGELQRRNVAVASSRAFEVSLGDDSHLEREIGFGIGAESLGQATQAEAAINKRIEAAEAYQSAA
jgi:hypothetical protein